MRVREGCGVLVLVLGAVSALYLPEPEHLPVTRTQVLQSNHHLNQLQDAAKLHSLLNKKRADTVSNAGLTNQHSADSSSHSGLAKQAARSNYAHQAANQDRSHADAAQSAKKASSIAASQEAAGKKAAEAEQISGKQAESSKHFKTGTHRKEKTSFAHDKTYDMNDIQDGQFELDEDKNSKVHDDVYDQSVGYDRNIDRYSAKAAGVDKEVSSINAHLQEAASANEGVQDKYGLAGTNNNLAQANQNVYNKLEGTSRRARTDTGLVKNQASARNKDRLTHVGAADTHIDDFNQAFAALGTAILPAYDIDPHSYDPSASDHGPSVHAVAKSHTSDAAHRDQLMSHDDLGVHDLTSDLYVKDAWNSGFDQSAGDKQGNDHEDYVFNTKTLSAREGAAQGQSERAAAGASSLRDEEQGSFKEDISAKSQLHKADKERLYKNKIFKRNFNNNTKNGNIHERLNYNKDVTNDAYGDEGQVQTETDLTKVQKKDNFDQSHIARQQATASANEAEAYKQGQGQREGQTRGHVQQSADQNTAKGVYNGYNGGFHGNELAHNGKSNVHQTQATGDNNYNKNTYNTNYNSNNHDNNNKNTYTNNNNNNYLAPYNVKGLVTDYNNNYYGTGDRRPANYNNDYNKNDNNYDNNHYNYNDNNNNKPYYYDNSKDNINYYDKSKDSNNYYGNSNNDNRNNNNYQNNNNNYYANYQNNNNNNNNYQNNNNNNNNHNNYYDNTNNNNNHIDVNYYQNTVPVDNNYYNNGGYERGPNNNHKQADPFLGGDLFNFDPFAGF